jgi:hypothetical protein
VSERTVAAKAIAIRSGETGIRASHCETRVFHLVFAAALWFGFMAGGTGALDGKELKDVAGTIGVCSSESARDFSVANRS